jgi:ribosomal protein S12 methylthiotransferase accessory factor YcaO
MLILDDSMSLDTQTEYAIQQALDELMQGRATFVSFARNWSGCRKLPRTTGASRAQRRGSRHTSSRCEAL